MTSYSACFTKLKCLPTETLVTQKFSKLWYMKLWLHTLFCNTEVVSRYPTKSCGGCGFICHIRCGKCQRCNSEFPESRKRLADGPPRRSATSVLAQLQKKVDVVITFSMRMLKHCCSVSRTYLQCH